VALLLGTRGFRVKDQSLWDFSAAGKRIGELDIKIEDHTGRAVSIIEALNLTSCDKTEIRHHIMKLLQKYNCSGLKENYILVYASTAEFADLCRKYRAHLEKMNYQSFPLQGKIAESNTDFNKITAFQARHRCNTGETVLYHLLVEM
jgi:hypothetical protein